ARQVPLGYTRLRAVEGETLGRGQQFLVLEVGVADVRRQHQVRDRTGHRLDLEPLDLCIADVLVAEDRARAAAIRRIGQGADDRIELRQEGRRVQPQHPVEQVALEAQLV